MRLLIVEDKKKTADYLCQGLNENGYLTTASLDGEDALFQLQESKFDLLILDVMLPKLDGWQILKEVRKSQKNLPILMLSACDTLEHRVRGLELGADDYLVKPFSFIELLARVKSLLRRGEREVCQRLQVLDLSVDLQKQTAYRGNKKLHLSPKELMLLTFLMKQQGVVVSRTVIAEQVWDINFHSNTNIIDVAIKRLREKVDKDCSQKLIHTVRGSGYVLEAR
jgi:heavy metal response regulator